MLWFGAATSSYGTVYLCGCEKTNEKGSEQSASGELEIFEEVNKFTVHVA